jgi:tRNA pseudouridine55 synthase
VSLGVETREGAHGVLVIDKPSGPTSHDVVARVRRALQTRRIGHTGTLDPLATGVLPLVIGKATRLASLLASDRKSYEAGVRLGCATESYDAAERNAAGLAPPAAPDIDCDTIEQALAGFRGPFMQAPPPYSAKKIGGVAAHRLARRDTPVQPAPVSVTVHDLLLVGVEDGLVRLRLTASAGFYVRSLAHELGARLGCGGHLETLRRTAAGEFTLDRAVPLDVVEVEGPGAGGRLIPMEDLLQGIPGVRLNDRGRMRVSHGNAVGPAECADAAGVPVPGKVRLLDEDGRLLAIANATAEGLLRPAVVLM